MALRWRRDLKPSRAFLRGTSSGAAIALVALLVVMVNYLGWKYHHRFDWTAEQLYSLSEKTENVLAALDRDVRVVVFLDPADPAWEPTRELLARYAAASPRLTVRHVDPGRNLLEAQRLVDRYELADGAVVFDAGERRRVVAAADLTEYDFSGLRDAGGAQVAGYRGEQRFTRALLGLMEGGEPRVLFTTGHGEISLDDTGPGGLGEAARILGDDNFELEEWASLGASAVPPGTDLVVVAGPTSSFLAPELEVFGDYLEAGGRMLFLLDPALGGGGGGLTQTSPLGLADWLTGYGVELGDNVVVDPANPLPFYGAGTQYADRYPEEHPITRSVRQAGVPVLVSLARSVGLGEVPADLAGTLLLETSPRGWGETDPAELERDGGDLAGPVPLAVVVEGRDGGGAEAAPEDAATGTGAGGPTALRLAVFGDSTFATDQLLAANAGNAALLADTLNWMVEREAALGIPAKRPEVVRLSLTRSQVSRAYLLVLVILPGLGVLLGAWVHYRRRR